MVHVSALVDLVQEAKIESFYVDPKGPVIALIYFDPTTGQEIREPQISVLNGGVDIYLTIRGMVSVRTAAEDFYEYAKDKMPGLKEPTKTKNGYKRRYCNLTQRGPTGLEVKVNSYSYGQNKTKVIQINSNYVRAEYIFLEYARSLGLKENRTRKKSFKRGGYEKTIELVKQ